MACYFPSFYGEPGSLNLLCILQWIWNIYVEESTKSAPYFFSCFRDHSAIVSEAAIQPYGNGKVEAEQPA